MIKKPYHWKHPLVIGLIALCILSAVGIGATRAFLWIGHTTPDASPTPTRVPTPLSPAPTASVTPIPTRPPFPTRANSPTPVATTGTLALTVRYHEPHGQSLSGIQIKTIAPNGQVFETKTDAQGHATITGLPPAHYMLDIYDGSYMGGKETDVSIGKTTTVSAELWQSLSSPTTAPDTTAPVLKNIRGPYDWGSQGMCLVITGSDYDEANSGYNVAWKMDSEDWSPYSSTQGTFCYTNLSPGAHTFSAKMKDGSGNEGNTLSTSFTLPL